MTLSDRIRAALQGGKSDGVSALISEVELAAGHSRDASAAARARALDPILSSDEVAQARKASEDAIFDAERMTRAAVSLREALTAFEASEAQERRRGVYDAARARRDAIVDRVRARYSVLANEIGELMAEMKAADADVLRANETKPNGADHLAGLDMVLRGFHPGVGDITSRASLPDAVALPGLSSPSAIIWRCGFPFNPDPNAGDGGHFPSPDRAGERGASGTQRSPVRLVPRDAGAAA